MNVGYHINTLSQRKICTREYFYITQIDSDQQVAGGDGTAGWLLEAVSDLKLLQPPPIATVPLGTGNNLHFAFGWVRYAAFFAGVLKFYEDKYPCFYPSSCTYYV